MCSPLSYIARHSRRTLLLWYLYREVKELQKGLNSVNESSAPTGRLKSPFFHRNLRKTDERKLLVHDNAIADLWRKRTVALSATEWRCHSVLPTFQRIRSKESTSTGLSALPRSRQLRRTNRPNSTTNVYYSTWRGPLKRLSHALFDTVENRWLYPF